MSSVHKFEGGAGCQVCEFPLTDRHHLLPMSEFNGVFDRYHETFANLCPNCHRMFHTVDGSRSSWKRQFTTIELVRMAVSGEIDRNLVPAICRLVIRSRTMRIDLLEEAERQNPVGSRVHRNRKIIQTSHEVIRDCEAVLDYLSTHGIRELTPLDMLIGGVA